MSIDQPARERRHSAPGRDVSWPEPPEPLTTPVVDAHCHLDIRDGEEWLAVPEAVRLAAEAGVHGIVQVGYDVESSRWGVRAAEEHPQILAAVALHPNEAPRIAAEQGAAALADAYAAIEALAGHPRVRAIGETGLDHFRTGEGGRAVQEESFRRHLALARTSGKALMIHDRDAHDDVVRVLLDEGPPETVVFHCFSGGPDLARTCADHGWFMSFAGTVTFKNAQPLRDALAVAPRELVLVETDAPFLAPTPYRGRPNASYLVPLTLRAMAEVRGDDVDELAAAVDANAARVFGAFLP